MSTLILIQLNYFNIRVLTHRKAKSVSMVPNKLHRESNVLFGFGRMNKSYQKERKKRAFQIENTKYTKTWN